ncbi:MAG: PAS domain S-box protein, partial [Chloroflexi bacterium]|nr:PAS domain S-box protein [Chloroflexota bacterium]
MNHFVLFIKNKLNLLIMLIALFFLGTGSWWLWQGTENQISLDQLNQEQISSFSLDVEALTALSDSNVDIGSYEYRSLKDSLTLMVSDHAIYQSAYLLGRREDGTLFFFAGSESKTLVNEFFPGATYPGDASGVLSVFREEKAIIAKQSIGLQSKRVSALFPLFDEASGKVIGVLGFDISAKDWNRLILQRAAFTIPVFLLSLSVILGAFFVSRSKRRQNRTFTARIFLPLVLILCLLSLLAIFAYSQQLKKWQGERIDAALLKVGSEFYKTTQSQVTSLASTLQSLTSNYEILQSLLKNDTTRLLVDWRFLFITLQKDFNIDQFDFYDEHQTALARLHQPEAYGDKVDRSVFLEASSTGGIGAGFELGTLDNYGLRVVEPAYFEGYLVGYVELGSDIGHILSSIKLDPGTQLIAVLDKDLIDRGKWEEGMRLLGKIPNWSRLSEGVVVFSSQDQLVDTLSPWLDQFLIAHTLGKSNDQSTVQGKDWKLNTISLVDESGQEVGELIVLLDLTAENKAFIRQFLSGLGIVLVILILLIGFTYYMLSRTDDLISLQQKKVEESERQFRYMFRDHSAVMLLTLPGSGSILAVNRSAEQFYGYSSEQLRTMSIRDLDPLSTKKKRIDPQEVTVEIQAIKKHRISSGEIRDVELNSAMIQYGAEAVLFSIVNDVTDKKVAEEKLIREKDDISRILATSETFLLSTQTGLDFQRITDTVRFISGGQYAVFNLLGSSGKSFQTVAISGMSLMVQKVSSLLGFDLKDKEWPIDKDRENRIKENKITRFPSLYDITEKGLPKKIIGRIIKLSNLGQVVIVKVFSGDEVFGDFTILMQRGSIFTADELVLLFVRQVRLLLQRNKIETSLRSSQEAYRQLVEQIPEVVYTFEIGRGFLFLGSKIMELCGYSSEELISDPSLWKGIMLEEDVKKYYEHYQNSVVGQVNVLEFRIKTKDDRTIWVRDHGELFETASKSDPIPDKRMVHGTLSDVSNEKRIESSLKESEVNFRTFFESLGDFIVVVNSDGKFIFSNENFNKTLGYSPHDLISMNIFDLFLDKNSQEINELLGPVLKGEVTSIDLAILKKSQESLPINLRIWRGIWNHEESIFAVAKDLRTEKEAEERFEHLFRNNPILMAVSSIPDQLFTDVNNAFLSSLGYSAGEVIGKNTQDLHLFVNPAQQDEAARRLQADGKFRDLQFQLRCKDGALKEGLFSGEIVSIQGRPFFLTAMIDITDRIMTEKKLSSSENRFRSLFEDSPLPMLENDYSAVKKRIDELREEGVRDFGPYFTEHPEVVSELSGLIKIININYAVLVMHGANSREELIENLPILFATGSETDFHEEMVLISSGATRFELETINRTLDGKKISIHLNWAVVPGYENDLSRVVVTLMDVTQRKQSEDALHEVNCQLEEAV